MVYDWKKQDKQLYLPKAGEPALVDVPEMKFFMLDGKGNPNGEQFEEEISVLYSLSYAIKMMPKKGITPDGYYEYKVFPLEGVWDIEVEGRNQPVINKDLLIYTIMIRQPDFVTPELAQYAMEETKKKKPHPLLENVRFESMKEGLCVQMLHVGPYDDEPASFAKMEEYCEQNGLRRACLTHREIYISDARKTAPEKLKTVLRFQVERMK